MKQKIQHGYIIGGVLFLLFALLTAAVLMVDVRPIGPQGSSVGLAAINSYVWGLFGGNPFWDHITDVAGITAVLAVLGFAALGLAQFIQRKSIKRVDASIIALGVFYLVLAIVYVLFEILAVNYRPVLMNGVLEASFPSSHVMLVLCIMGTAMMQFQDLLKNKATRTAAYIVAILVMAITIIGRLISGVHWFTDILGGVLLASALVMLYYAIMQSIKYTSCSQ